MSLCVRYAGDGYTYLLDSVTVDHGRSGASPMTRYYAAAGTPPGTWIGSGLAGLACGHGLPAGSTVTPTQMERLYRDASDPVTYQPLGRSPHVYNTPTGRDRRRPVAGFDATFTVPKSVSVLWALADDVTREVLYDCHRSALAEVMTVFERDVARTRIGTGGVAQVETRGVAAATFDHWDSRRNDPNLHTHVVVANRVQGPDGRWRTLDSKAVHRATVALSERYDTLLADQVTARLGLGWEYRERGPRRNPSYEMAAVPSVLVEEFSRRAAAITAESDRLVDAYVADHGHEPAADVVLKLRQRATLATRDAKTVHSLAELTDQWRARATSVIGTDSSGWAAQVLTARRPATPVVDLEPALADAATAVMATLSRTRTTWTPWNVEAEACRALKAVRFASAAARDQATARVVADVARQSVLLSAPELAATPEVLRRSDGSSAFRPHRGEVYTSPEVLAAEARLLDAAQDLSGPALDVATAGDQARRAGLSGDQAAAVAAIAASGRVVDVLVGPAGSGKTRTLAALRAAWEPTYGPGSVVALAPSAAAADVLRAALGVPAENTAKWLVEHDLEPERLHRAYRARAALRAAPDAGTAQRLAGHLERLKADVERWRFRPGQLVIVDEASLADTRTLDRLATCAGQAGARLVLVGDWAQLSSIEAGGAFGLLVRDRGTAVPQLDGIHRFTQAWERTASTQLRVGDTGAVDAYAAHSRLIDGNHDAMIDAAFTAWAADERAGRRSLLIAGDLDTVRTLNERARSELVATGRVRSTGVALHDGLTAGVGDRIVTRRNNRHLTTGRAWVKNGDAWTVRAVQADGGMDVRRDTGGPVVALPAAYVAEHVDLGYATTAFRAQGTTVDTAHAVVTGPGMKREVLYVLLTRARHANHAYICTDRAVEPLAGFTDPGSTGRSVLTAILSNSGADLSAHETLAAEQDAASSTDRLAAEYATIARIAEAPRWLALLAAAGLSEARCAEVEASTAFGALTLALRRAEAHGLDVTAALPILLTRSSNKADDLAAVLHARVERWTSSVADPASSGGLTAGLLPAPTAAGDAGIQAALRQRAELIRARSDARADRAPPQRALRLAGLPPDRGPAAIQR